MFNIIATHVVVIGIKRYIMHKLDKKNKASQKVKIESIPS